MRPVAPLEGDEHMNSSVLSGLIGGAIAVVLMTYLSARIRREPNDGTLQWGWWLAALGFASLGIAGMAVGALFFDETIWADRGELYSAAGLILGFGTAACYCLVEYFCVRGSYDDDGIEFHTPWSGAKIEHWKDLKSVRFNNQMNWYVLRFNSGKTIRISNVLSGHGGVVDIIVRLGFEAE